MFLSKILILSCIIELVWSIITLWKKAFLSFIIEEILKRHIKDCYKINGKQRITVPKKGEHVKFENYERKIKSPFLIYADFESIVVPEDNEKQNPSDSYTNKYRKHVACGYGYK